MPETQDPRVQKIVQVAGGVGAAVVAVIAVVATIVFGTSLIAAGVVALVALAMVNFVLPVGMRALALARQKALTALSENFSEETIREDERQEGVRVQALESSYMESRSQLEGAQDELRAQLATSSPEERELINGQISAMQEVVDNAEATLRQRKADYAELQRVNKLYIALQRSALAMQASGQAERDPQQRQNLETARTAIKNRMRAAMAGQTIQAMNSALSAAHPQNALPFVGGADKRPLKNVTTGSTPK